MYIEIINYILINRGHTWKKEIGQIFILKSKFGIFYMDFCADVKYWLVFFYYSYIFLSINNLIVAEP